MSILSRFRKGSTAAVTFLVLLVVLEIVALQAWDTELPIASIWRVVTIPVSLVLVYAFLGIPPRELYGKMTSLFKRDN